MRKLLIVVIQLLALGIYAQAPKEVNYQGVARDAFGVPIGNKTMSIRFEVFQGTGATPVFTESQSITTNSLGLFTTQIGKVQNFGGINLENGSLQLKIGIDTTGGSNFIDLGPPQRISSVPFAMHASGVPTTYSNNILSIGSKTYVLTQAVTFTNNVLTVGPASNSVVIPASQTSLTGSGAANITTLSPNSYSLHVASPSLTLLSPGTLSITNGNSVSIAPSLNLSGGVLTVGPASNSVTLPQVGTNISTSGNITNTVAGNNYSLNVPPTVITQSGVAQVTGGPNNFTVNVPASTFTLTNSSTGPATIVPVTPNNFSVNIPPPVPQTLSLLGPNSLSITNGNAVTLAPSLAVSGTSLSVGPTTNAIQLPTVAISQSGVAQVTGGPLNYNVNVPATHLNVTQSPGSISMATITANSFSLNIPPNITPTINATGLATASQSGNSLTVHVPLLSYTAGNGALGSGTNIINITPTVALNGTTLSVGPLSNNVDLGVLAPWRDGATTVTLATNSDLVGVGTVSPNAKLDVIHNGTISALNAQNTNPSTTAYAGTFDGGIVTKGKNNLGTANALVAQNASGTDIMVVKNNADIAVGGSLFVVNNGKVGIGTATPGQELTIVTNANTGVALLAGTTSQAHINLGDGTTAARGSIRYDNNDNSMNFWTNTVAGRVKIDNAGNVGINSATPSEKLDVTGNVRFSGAMMPNNLPGTSGQFLQSAGPGIAPTWVTGGILTGGTTNYLPKWSGTTGLTSTSQVFDNGTNVGIGNNNPQQKLDVTGYIRVGSGPLTADEAWLLYSPTPGLSSLRAGQRGNTEMRFDQGNNAPMTFWTNNVERMRVTNSGDVGIGTASPNQNSTTGKVLTISATSVYASQAAAIELAGASLTISVPVGKVDFNSVGSSVTNIARVSGHRVGGTDDGMLQFHTASGGSLSERIRITDVGRVGVNNQNPTKQFQVNGDAAVTHSNLVTGYAAEINNTTPTGGQSSGGLLVTNSGFRSIGHIGVTIDNITTKTGGNNSIKTGLEINSTGSWGAGGSGGHINRGLMVNVSGGADANYAAIMMGGHVGIGVANPTSSFAVGNGGIQKLGISGVNGSVLFTDEQGSITFAAAATPTLAPMINMFASGTANAKRMVIQHSPFWPTYGLQYEDMTDRFHFIGNDLPVLTADLGSYRVGIGTFAPNNKLHVVDNISSAVILAQNLSTSSCTAVHGMATGAGGTGDRTGVAGESSGGNNLSHGVYGRGGGGYSSFGVRGYATGGATNYNIGVYGEHSGGANAYGGYFSGNVWVGGTLSKSAGTFKIDHPQDPANKYLIHSFVESPDMMNIYNGNITTDANGDATVQLPGYFQAENMDFRYQLTVVGQFAQVAVMEEISNNQFVIKTDKPNVKVSWQVTGIRNDEYAKQNRVVPEVEKTGKDRGRYLHPELYGFGKELKEGPVNPNDAGQ